MSADMKRYEDQGLLLHPCKEDKSPLLKGWQSRASCEPSQLEEWFSTGQYKVGLLTGERNGIVVLDFDDKPMARRFFKEFRDKIKTLVETPRGIHAYFAHPGGRVANTVKARIGDVIADIRGDGGYVVAPHTYRFVEGFELDVKRLVSLDALKIERKGGKGDARLAIKDPIKYISRIRAIQGQNGSGQCFRACCVLRDSGLFSESETLAAMIIWNETNAEPPFNLKELAHKVTDA
ncbi:MAG: bifunctional DNA primase/polymerase, partial [Magnetococcus sp. WYHC-3]